MSPVELEKVRAAVVQMRELARQGHLPPEAQVALANWALTLIDQAAAGRETLKVQLEEHHNA